MSTRTFLFAASCLIFPTIGVADTIAEQPTPPGPVFAQELGKIVTTPTKLICGGIPNATYDTRIRAVRLIGKSIPSSDFAALLAFLEKNPANDPATSDELDAIRNDVAARLLACDHLPDDFSRRFLAMANAPQVGPVWQNYTVQFLDTLWKRENDPEQRKAIYNTLIAVTYHPTPSMSGTALLTLSRLPDEAGLSKKSLGNIAMRLVESPDIPWQDKITALQVAANAGDTRALTQARTWVNDSATPVPLRMSALATIGTLGNDTDRPLLDRFAQSGEFRLRTAAHAALKKLASHEPAPKKN